MRLNRAGFRLSSLETGRLLVGPGLDVGGGRQRSLAGGDDVGRWTMSCVETSLAASRLVALEFLEVEYLVRGTSRASIRGGGWSPWLICARIFNRRISSAGPTDAAKSATTARRPSYSPLKFPNVLRHRGITHSGVRGSLCGCSSERQCDVAE